MAVYKNTVQVILINGPSKMDLCTAFVYAFDKQHPFTVTFTDEAKRAYKVQIIGLSHEDGSGASFNFTGNATGPAPINPIYEGSFNVKGYFHTDGRKGSMTIEYYTADNK